MANKPLKVSDLSELLMGTLHLKVFYKGILKMPNAYLKRICKNLETK